MLKLTIITFMLLVGSRLILAEPNEAREAVYKQQKNEAQQYRATVLLLSLRSQSANPHGYQLPTQAEMAAYLVAPGFPEAFRHEAFIRYLQEKR